MSAKTCLLLLGFSCAFPAGSQDLHRILGARAAALGNACTPLAEPWNNNGNPAGIALQNAPGLAFALERPFLLKELDTRAFNAVLPLKREVLGLLAQAFGSRLYGEQLLSLNYARAFSPRFRTGLRFSYHGLALPEQANLHAFSISAGVQLALRSSLTLGAYISNPNRAEFAGEQGSRLPLRTALGLAYAFSEKVLSLLEQEWLTGREPSLKAGLEYAVHRLLALRLGLSTAPLRQCGGLGLRHEGFRLDLAASLHPRLGFSPQFALAYEF